MCWIEGTEKGYVLHRETIEEDIPNLNGEIVHVKYPLYLAKTAENYERDIGNYEIPERLVWNDKTQKMDFSSKKTSIFSFWLKSIKRRTKRKETFIQKGRDCFPVFDHIAITPELARKYSGDFSIIQPYLDFIKEHICGNNQELFNYFMKYQAHLIQKPGVKMGVVIVTT